MLKSTVFNHCSVEHISQFLFVHSTPTGAHRIKAAALFLSRCRAEAPFRADVVVFVGWISGDVGDFK